MRCPDCCGGRVERSLPGLGDWFEDCETCGGKGELEVQATKGGMHPRYGWPWVWLGYYTWYGAVKGRKPVQGPTNPETGNEYRGIFDRFFRMTDGGHVSRSGFWVSCDEFEKFVGRAPEDNDEPFYDDPEMLHEEMVDVNLFDY